MVKVKSKFIIDIVPLTKIPLTSNQTFSYLSEEELPSGTLVSISFFHRKIEGVVLESRKDFLRLGNIELKKIDKVLEKEFLDEKQIRLAKFISEYYFSSLGVVLKNFIPKRTKSRKIKTEESYGEKIAKKIKLTAQQAKAVELIVNNNNFLLFGPSGSGKTEVYIHSILQIKKQNPKAQFLILVPERTLTPQALERYGKYFSSKEIVLLSSDISKGQFYSAWQRIKSGEAKVIIGTRMAVFAPFKKLELIVIDEEQDMSYKQWDMNPRYDARTCAEKLAKLHTAKIVRGSATPSVESYWRAANRELKLLELPEFKLQEKKTAQFEIVDMKKERWNKNYSCISKKLKSEIEFALKYGQQIILFINRQGMSSFSVCDGCKTVLVCPNCERALLYDEKGNYRCSHCSYRTSIIPKCPKCQGIVFKNIGLGTQKVEKEIGNIFPNARVGRLDSQSAQKTGEQKKIYADFSTGKIDILIGSQMITKGWDLPKVALIGIIDTDNMLFFPDFRTEEKAFQNLLQVAGRAGRPGARFPGKIIIQTYRPENKIIQLVSKRDLESFYQNEIDQRKSLFLPPWGRIIKFIFQDFSQEKAEKEACIVHNALLKIKNIKISDPHSPLISKIRGRFRRQIIIKIKHQKIPEELQKEIARLKNGWMVDVDPISII